MCMLVNSCSSSYASVFLLCISGKYTLNMRHFPIFSNKAKNTILINHINGFSSFAKANTTSCPEGREVDFELSANDMPFSLAKHGNFLQNPPQLQNTYVGDSLLVQYLHRYLPKEVCIFQYFIRYMLNMLYIIRIIKCNSLN